MIKKNILNIFIIIVTIFIFSFINPIEVNAKTSGDNFLDEITTGANTLISTGKDGMDEKNITIDMDLIKSVAQLLYFVGCVVVITLTIQKAVKYGLSSPGEKASVRRGLLGWIIICVLVIASFPFFELILSIFDEGIDYDEVLEELENTAEGLTEASADSPIVKVLNTIFRVIQVGGIGYIVIRFTVIGIKYFTLHTTARDPKSKAEVKNELYNTVILSAIIFGAVGFFEIIYRAFND